MKSFRTGLVIGAAIIIALMEITACSSPKPSTTSTTNTWNGTSKQSYVCTATWNESRQVYQVDCPDLDAQR